MITLTRTREDAVTLLSLRAQIRDLEEQADALAAVLRPALAHWTTDGQGVAVSATTAVYVTPETTRKGWDRDALDRLAQTIPEVAACRTTTPVRASIRDRKRKATDR